MERSKYEDLHQIVRMYVSRYLDRSITHIGFKYETRILIRDLHQVNFVLDPSQVGYLDWLMTHIGYESDQEF